jgi:hypothetical protein
MATKAMARASNPASGFIDVGANLLDSMFQGVYRDKQLHAADLDAVIRRASQAGCRAILVTAGTPEESLQTQELCRTWSAKAEGTLLRTTVG